MTLKLLITTILYLTNEPTSEAIQHYADLIHYEANWYQIDPLLVIAIIHVESGWNSTKRSITNDYGLMQVHVARRGSSNFHGREKELLIPRNNIREGVRILAMWKRYHEKWCTTTKTPHTFWNHYKWGYRVKDTKWADKVTALHQRLSQRHSVVYALYPRH